MAFFVLRHRVDAEVAARQILFERDGRIGMEREAVVARRGLALGARERVFLLRLWMQKDREVAPHRQKAGVDHLLGRGADDDPVAIVHRRPEQRVAHRAADHVKPHQGSLMV